MSPAPVPCPRCSGLVDKTTLRCASCGASWANLSEMLYDGLCASSERALQIAECLDVCEAENARPMWDAITLERKYQLEIERMERR